MAKYILRDEDGRRVTDAIWDAEGAWIGNVPEERYREGSGFYMSTGGSMGRVMELEPYDEAADAKFRTECERQGIDYRRDWT